MSISSRANNTIKTTERFFFSIVRQETRFCHFSQISISCSRFANFDMDNWRTGGGQKWDKAWTNNGHALKLISVRDKVFVTVTDITGILLFLPSYYRHLVECADANVGGFLEHCEQKCGAWRQTEVC